jgi:hypothetical protein
MAKLVKPDGEIEEVLPKRTNRWTLDEVQAHVEGPVEVMPWQPLRMLINEEAKLHGKPRNVVATQMLHEVMAKKLGCTVAQLPTEVGRRLRYLPDLRGNVLVLSAGERF